jgi:hypothetical protein
MPTESFRDLWFGVTCYLLQNSLDRLNPPFSPGAPGAQRP